MMSIGRLAWGFVCIGVLALSSTARAEAPWLEWVRLLDPPAEPYAFVATYDIAMDAAGNAFTAGSGYLTKHAPDGELAWHLEFPADMFAVAVGADGDVFAAGQAGGEVDLDPGPGTWLTTGNDGPFAFVVRLSSDGRLIWAWTTKFVPPEKPHYSWIRSKMLSVDSQGSVILAGSFSGTHDFGPEPHQNRLTHGGRPSSFTCGDIFVCKIDGGGRTMWAKQTHSMISVGENTPLSVLADPRGDVVVHARTTALTLDFGDAYSGFEVHPLEQEGRYDVRANGKYLAYALAGSTGELLWSTPLDLLASNYSTYPDAPGFVHTAIEPDGEAHAFVLAKFDARTDLQWTWEFPLPTRKALAAHSTATDAEGNVFVSLMNCCTLAYPATAHSPAVEVEQGGVIVKLAPGGELEWVYPLDGVNFPYPIRMAANPDGTVSATGIFRMPADFGGAHEELWVEPNARKAVFVMRLGAAPDEDALELAGESSATDRRVLAENRPAEETAPAAEGTHGGVIIVTNAPDGEGAVDESVERPGGIADDAPSLDGWFDTAAETPMPPISAGLASSNAPWLEWIHTMGGDWAHVSFDKGRDIALDAAGNAFAVGLMADEATATDDPMLQHGHFGYLAKHAANGDLEWIVQYPAEMSSVAVDSQGNVYAVGMFGSLSFDFDPGPGVWMLDTDGSQGMFVVKFSNDGELLWAWDISGEPISHGQSSLILPHSIAVGDDDALFVTGSFEGGYEFGPAPGDNRIEKPGPNQGHADMFHELFVCKLSAEGEVQWARQTMAVYNIGSAHGWADVVIDPFGHPVVRGAHGSYFVVGTAETEYEFLPIDHEDAHEGGDFHMRLDAATGDPHWVRPLHEDHMTFAEALNGPGFARVIPPQGSFNLMIGKFDASGDLYWSWGMQGDHPISGLGARTVMGEDGGVYTSVAMVYQAEMPAGLETPAFAMEGGSLIFKLTADGALQWAYPLWDLFTPEPISLAVGADGSVVATGQFYQTADFGGLFESLPVTTGSHHTVFTLQLSAGVPPMPGDVNGDGVINAVDVQLVINAALGMPMNPTHRADVTGSGTVNASDVQLVINAVLDTNPGG